jgi:hypothetical protein
MVNTMNYMTNSVATPLMLVLRLCFIFMAIAFSNPIQSEESPIGFDHFSTGFPLIGRHEFIDCADCHVAGQFKGTTMQCGLCHNGIRAPGKNPNHVPSSIFCDDCHTERTWLGAKYDHIEVRGTCQSCHNNVIAVGKSPSHILTTDICEDCHNTIVFDRVGRVDHSQVFGLCSSCHNGAIATGKPPGHIQTTEECNACHTVFTWKGATK